MHLIDQHPFSCAMVALLVFNAAVGAMEAPLKPGAYRYWYRFLNGLVLNFEQLARSRFPQLPQLPSGASIDAHIDIPPDLGPSPAADTGQGTTPSP